MASSKPWLPSTLPSQPAFQDTETTPERLESAIKIGKVTNPSETALFICAFAGCYKLFPTRERTMLHRKRDHNTTDDHDIITWNEDAKA